MNGESKDLKQEETKSQRERDRDRERYIPLDLDKILENMKENTMF